MLIIDSHSHIGIEFYQKNAKKLTPESYYEDVAQPMHITDVLLMPQPTPVVEDGMFSECFEEKTCVLRWECDESLQPTYFSNCTAINMRNLKNPYIEVNEYYFKVINRYNANKSAAVRAFFVPLCHPVLDSDDYWEKVISEFSPPALKIHTVGSASLPEDVSKNKIDILKYYDIPLLLHTDCKRKSISKPLGLEKYIHAASSYKWAVFLNRYSIKGVLNHGGRLEHETFDIVSKSDYVYVGLGPDYYLSTKAEELAVNPNDDSSLWYLKHLYKSLPAEKLLFDMDYNYNYGCNSLDCCTIDRILSVWDFNSSKRILFDNANSLFFGGRLR